MSETKILIDDLFKSLTNHANLISKGVDNRTALELSFGKEVSDKSFKQLAEIQQQKFHPNQNQN